jgi:hypothetical protein
LENLPTRFQRQIVTTSPYAVNQIVVESEKKQVFNFDHVYPPETTQEEIYEKSVENLVNKFLEGRNIIFFFSPFFVWYKIFPASYPISLIL